MTKSKLRYAAIFSSLTASGILLFSFQNFTYNATLSPLGPSTNDAPFITGSSTMRGSTTSFYFNDSGCLGSPSATAVSDVDKKFSIKLKVPLNARTAIFAKEKLPSGIISKCYLIGNYTHSPSANPPVNYDTNSGTQNSNSFGFSRRVETLITGDESINNNYTQDLMFITAGKTESGKNYSFFTFGDTLTGNARLFGNTVGWSDDFDLSNGTKFNFRQNYPHFPGMGMTPMNYRPHADTDVDAKETQIWFSRSFVLGQDIYSYYGSYAANHKTLGVGLAVLRGGVTDAGVATNKFGEFERIPKSKFWTVAYWFDGAPIVKTESDGKTYLYLFNQFGVQRTLATPDGVETLANYETWDGANWARYVKAAPMWTDEFTMRPSCEWNEYLHKWVAVYAPWNSGDGVNSQLVYRTANNITGPWSARTVFLNGHTEKDGGRVGAGDYYSPVYRSFYDRNGGQTIYTFASSGGSSGPIGVFEHTFDHKVTTANLGSIPEFTPQGLDGTTNVNVDGISKFYFGETVQSFGSGRPEKKYSNSFLSISKDFDVAGGLTFDSNFQFEPLRSTRSPDKSFRFISAFRLQQFGKSQNYIGTLTKVIDSNGQELGTGFAYSRGNGSGIFKSTGGLLSKNDLVSKITQVIPGTLATVVINDELDPQGSVYIAKAGAQGLTSPVQVGGVLTNTSSYSFSTKGTNAKGYETRIWTQSASDAAPIFANAIKPSVIKSEYTGGWIAIYTVKNSDTGENSQIAMRTAQSIVGPWSEPVTLYTVINTNHSKGRLSNATYLNGYDLEGGRTLHFYATDYDTKKVNLFQVKLNK